MDQKIRFRKAGLSDVASLVNLVNRAYRGDESKVGWTTEADLLDGQRTDKNGILEMIRKETACILVGEAEDKIISCVYLERRLKNSEVICYLGLFTVDPREQARGVGKQSLQESESFAKKQWGAQRVEMTVLVQRQELIDWYGRRGYAPTGEFVDFPYGDERFGIPKRSDLKLKVFSKKI